MHTAWITLKIPPPICGNWIILPCRSLKSEALNVLPHFIYLEKFINPPQGNEWDNLLLIRLTFHLLLPSTSGIFLHNVKHCSFTVINSCPIRDYLRSQRFAEFQGWTESFKRKGTGRYRFIATVDFPSLRGQYRIISWPIWGPVLLYSGKCQGVIGPLLIGRYKVVLGREPSISIGLVSLASHKTGVWAMPSLCKEFEITPSAK